jgi:glycosyltransferase involved in cell wall biosynthesis
VTSRPTDLYQGLRRQAGRVKRRLVQPTDDVPAAPSHGSPPGRQPRLARETTHLGPMMDDLVLRARRRMRIGADPDDDLLYENFDVLHYLLASPRLMDRPRIDLIEHFQASGVEARLSPDPHFSMAAYLERHPERAKDPERSPYLAWLKEGRAAGEIADPAPGIEKLADVLGLEQQQLVDLVVERRRDLIERFRTGKLGEMFVKASEIEPLIGECWPEITRPKMVPLTTPLVVDEVAALHQAQAAAGFRPARLVLVINRARWGAGRRMEGHLAHALAAYVRPDEIVVIYTDDSTTGPDDRFPEGVREIDFFAIGGGLSEMQSEHALVTFIRTLHADAVVNINSKLLYQAMRTYGKALAASERVFLCFFCNEQTTMGTWRGWSLRTFYRTFDDVAGVITDSHYLRDDLVDTYRVGGRQLERLHVFSAPVDPALPLVSGPRKDPQRRPQVFWAGRWDRQKRVGLVVQLAQKMPDVDFRMWGASVMGSRPRDLRWNVKAEGVYENISEIPLAEADVWLYTSGWDGVPSQLLEVAMTGIPIVGTLVGGTGEVLTDADAWPVPEQEGVEAYERAIRAVLADPGRARKRARQLRKRLERDRTEEAFATAAAQVLLTDGEERP